MISLYQYLTEVKNYTEEDADIAVCTYELGLLLPDKVKQDISDYWKGGYNYVR